MDSQRKHQRIRTDIWFILWLIVTLLHFGSGDFSTTDPSNCNSSLKWSPWINRDTPVTGDGDEEYMTPTEKQVFCGNGTIQNVECYTIGGIPFYSSGEITTCTFENGSICKNADNYPLPCSDYKIRYRCLVDICPVKSSTSQTSSTTATTFVETSQTGMEVDLIVVIIFVVIAILGVTLVVVLFVWKRQSRKRKTTASTDKSNDDA